MGILSYHLFGIILHRRRAGNKVGFIKAEEKIHFQGKRCKYNRSSLTLQHQHTINSLILHKLEYDLASNPSESCDWLNVFFAQFLSHLRNDQSFLDKLIFLIDERILNDSSKRPSFLGPISINELSLGEEFPVLRNARVQLGDHEDPMKILIDFVFDDQITFAIDTQALINWPQPSIASLPITLSVSLVKFTGTIALEFKPGQEASHAKLKPAASDLGDPVSNMAIDIYIMQDFALEFSVGSLLGHRTKVKDLPKLTSLITGALRSVFVKELVYPSKKTISIPSTIL